VADEKRWRVQATEGWGLHSSAGNYVLMDGQVTFMISSHSVGKVSPYGDTGRELISMCMQREMSSHRA
jgi:hypothetical protein